MWTQNVMLRTLRNCLPSQLRRIAQPLVNELLVCFQQPYAPEAKRLSRELARQPELQQLHAYCLKHNTWPSPLLSPPKMNPIAPFLELEVPDLPTLADLADWLLVPHEHIDSYVDRVGWREEHGETHVNHYFTHLSPKSSGGLRLIEAPKPRLKSFQRLILLGILSQVPTHPDSFAFTAGRDCRGGARRHSGEEVVICFDLKDYFTSIRSSRIFGLFRCLGYPSAVAHALTGLCTVVTPSRVRDRLSYDQRQMVRAPHLPQGAPSSPALANLVTHRLDRRLSGLARTLGGFYSRYADDMTFSGDHYIRKAVLDAVPEIVRDEGFRLNPNKTRVMASHERQIVTGLVVNQRLNVTRREFDRLKAVIHAKSWREDPSIHARLMGQIGWVVQVHPAKGEKLRNLMERS